MGTPRRRLNWVLALGVLLSIAAGFGKAYADYHGVRVVTEGRVYVSGAMDDGALGGTVRELGLRTVVDFRKVDEEADRAQVEHEREVLAGLGVRHVSFPSSQVPSQRKIDRFLDLIEAVEYPVLLHCEHGEGRAPLYSALYRIEYEDWDNDAARRATRHPWHLPWSSFAADAPKGELLLSYLPRHKLVGDGSEAAPAIDAAPGK